MNRLLFLLLSIMVASCIQDDYVITVDPIAPLGNTIVLGGTVFIEDTITTESRQAVLIKPGADIQFGPHGIIVANGDVYIEGTPSMPVKLTGSQERISHRIIQVRWDAKVFRVKNTMIEDGLITSVADWNHISDTEFVNTKQLKWNDAAARFWYGELLIENCTTIGNNRGEGFLVHDMDNPMVMNCSFNMTPDAVEYIDCLDGAISGNVFRNTGDDGIDLNACNRTLISNNEFYNVSDRALELGSQNFGSSRDLVVQNNLFANCNVAINLKEASTVTIENSTFYENNIDIEVSNHPDSIFISAASVNSSVFVGTDMPFTVTGISSLHLKNCLGSMSLPEGQNNTMGEVIFADPDQGDFSIISDVFPDGFDAQTLGYQKQ